MEEALLRDGPRAPTAARISALPGEGDGWDATLGGERPGLRRETAWKAAGCVSRMRVSKGTHAGRNPEAASFYRTRSRRGGLTSETWGREWKHMGESSGRNRWESAGRSGVGAEHKVCLTWMCRAWADILLALLGMAPACWYPLFPKCQVKPLEAIWPWASSWAWVACLSRDLSVSPRGWLCGHKLP